MYLAKYAQFSGGAPGVQNGVFQVFSRGQKTPQKIAPYGSNIAKKGCVFARGRPDPGGQFLIPEDNFCTRDPQFLCILTKRGILRQMYVLCFSAYLANYTQFSGGVPGGDKILFSGILPGTKNIPKNSPPRF